MSDHHQFEMRHGSRAGAPPAEEQERANNLTCSPGEVEPETGVDVLNTNTRHGTGVATAEEPERAVQRKAVVALTTPVPLRRSRAFIHHTYTGVPRSKESATPLGPS